MGQYYKPINLDKFEWLYSHDYKSGLKLMEHSYTQNSFVGSVMNLLTKGKKWYKTRIVWCGDYAETCFENLNLYGMAYDDEDYEMKLFKKIKPTPLKAELVPKAILVNHTKKEYVKLAECKEDGDGYTINPLPLLTAIGNGGGGGDYHGTNMAYVGSWAGNIISVEFEEPRDYTKINPNFVEGEESGNSDENENEFSLIIKKWLNEDEVKKRLVIGKLK